MQNAGWCRNQGILGTPLDGAQQAQSKVSVERVQRIAMKIACKEKDGVGKPATVLRLKILHSVARSEPTRLLRRSRKCSTDTMLLT